MFRCVFDNERVERAGNVHAYRYRRRNLGIDDRWCRRRDWSHSGMPRKQGLNRWFFVTVRLDSTGESRVRRSRKDCSGSNTDFGHLLGIFEGDDMIAGTIFFTVPRYRSELIDVFLEQENIRDLQFTQETAAEVFLKTSIGVKSCWWSAASINYPINFIQRQ